jgi:hypothetical protein
MHGQQVEDEMETTQVVLSASTEPSANPFNRGRRLDTLNALVCDASISVIIPHGGVMPSSVPAFSILGGLVAIVGLAALFIRNRLARERERLRKQFDQ